jgi:hypothetical protein
MKIKILVAKIKVCTTTDFNSKNLLVFPAFKNSNYTLQKIARWKKIEQNGPTFLHDHTSNIKTRIMSISKSLKC